MDGSSSEVHESGELPRETDPAPLGDTWFQERLPSPQYHPPIFFSFPTPTSRDQFEMVKVLYKILSRNGLTPRTLGVNEYDFHEPLRAIRRLLNQSHGLLALAFRKTTVDRGSTVRRRGDEAPRHEVLSGLGLTSPWVQIETAMAYQIDIPIMILREQGVNDDGLLQDGVVVHHMPVFDFENGTSAFFKGQEFNAALKQFVQAVNGVAFGAHNRVSSS